MKLAGRCWFLAACGLLFGATVSAQGVYFETSNPQNGGEVTKIWYMPHMVKSLDADHTISIIRLDRQEMYSVDPATKTFKVMTFADMKAKYSGAMGQMDKILQERMKTMSPDQRKMMEERMAALKTKKTETAVTSAPTGRTKRIAGYACREYIVTRNGKEGEHVWVTKDLQEGEAMHKDLAAFQQQMASIIGADERKFQWFGVESGFPLERDEDGTTETVTRIEREAIPASEFEVPAGFKKVSAADDDGDH